MSTVNELRELERELLTHINRVDADLRTEVTRVRTAVYVAAVLIGGSQIGNTVAGIIQPPTPIVVQQSKETVP